jgi:hypothetical protein
LPKSAIFTDIFNSDEGIDVVAVVNDDINERDDTFPPSVTLSTDMATSPLSLVGPVLPLALEDTSLLSIDC